MKFLKNSEFLTIKSIYDERIKYFPIITSVVEQLQQGYILKKEGTYLIVHNFGFAYLLGNNIDYINFLNQAIEKLKSFIPKLRLYDPMNRLNNTYNHDFQKSTRVKYENLSNLTKKENNLFLVNELNNDVYKSFELDLNNRYWSNCQEFKIKSLGLVDKEMKGICYAAAISDGYAEIDIFVKEKYRLNGLAKKLVMCFKNECYSKKIIPVWDCYLNNIGSVKLAEKTNFNKLFEYNFYNIEKEYNEKIL